MAPMRCNNYVFYLFQEGPRMASIAALSRVDYILILCLEAFESRISPIKKRWSAIRSDWLNLIGKSPSNAWREKALSAPIAMRSDRRGLSCEALILLTPTAICPVNAVFSLPVGGAPAALRVGGAPACPRIG